MLHAGWKSVLNEGTTLVKRNVFVNYSSSSRMEPLKWHSIFKEFIAYIKILNDFSVSLLFTDKFANIRIKEKNGH